MQDHADERYRAYDLMLRDLDTLNEEGLVASALLLSREIVRRNPEQVLAHRFLAEHLGHRGLLDEAAVHYQRSLDLGDEFQAYDTLVSWGLDLYAERRYEDAMQKAAQAAAFKPFRCEAHLLTVDCLLCLDRNEEVERTLNFALKSGVEDANLIWAYLGEYYLNHDNYGDARHAFANALKIAPNDESAQLGLTDAERCLAWDAARYQPAPDEPSTEAKD